VSVEVQNHYDRFFLWKCMGCGAVTVLTAAGGTLADCKCGDTKRDYGQYPLETGESRLLSDMMGTGNAKWNPQQ